MSPGAGPAVVAATVVESVVVAGRDLGGWGPAVRDLTVAAGRVAVAARMAGEAWLGGADGTWCRVTYGGDVAPSTGWAAAAARIINRSINIP